MDVASLSAFLLLAVACLTAANPDFDANAYEVRLDRHTGDHVSGALRTAAGKTALLFQLHKDDSNSDSGGLHRSLRLSRAHGRSLLSANWSTADDGSLTVSRFSVMGRRFALDLDAEQMETVDKQERTAFDDLRGTDEFKLLPVLSQLLGEKYSVTGYGFASALPLHRLALNAQKLHNTLDKDRKTAKHRVKRCDLGLNPWSDCSSDTFACDSPKGRCANGILDYTTPDSCNYRGTPVTPSDYSSGCYGMCGPGCYNCWTYICGDCCIHPGCTQHDGECSSYTSFDCLTAKGVLWGTGDSQYSDNC